MNQLEEGTVLKLDFDKLGDPAENGIRVVPVVLQHADTREVLFIGYANDQALSESFETRRAVLWSTSRNEIWRKGDTSGDILALVEVRVNCEQNSLLYLVRPRGTGVCHTRDKTGQTRPTCFYRRVHNLDSNLTFV